MTTVRVIVEDAFRKAGVVAHDEPMTADYAAHGLRELNRMLKGWQNYKHNLWAVALQEKTLTTSRSYTLDPVRPMRILDVRLERDGIETPMQELTRAEYDCLPDKDSTGLPSSWYYDRQRAAAVLYVWPVFEEADDETLQITYERELDDQDDLNVEPDSPIEWEDCVVHNLAVRVSHSYPNSTPIDPDIKSMAVGLLQQALAADREGSVFFYEEGYGRGRW